MDILKKIALAIIDAIFPPKTESAILKSITAENLHEKSRPLLAGRDLPETWILFEYKNEVTRGLLLELKNHGDKKACAVLAQALHEKLIEELGDESIMSGFTSPLLVPIPITRKTRMNRGWNQCELLAKEIEKIDGGANIEISCDVLSKTRQTDDQVGKSKAEREKNLKGCFTVKNPEKIKNRNIILLDDIITTGATMREAKKTLLEAGAKRVIGLAVAH